MDWKLEDRSVGLGIGVVFYLGIIVNTCCAQSYGFAQLNKDMPAFIQEFGLILFVYTARYSGWAWFFSSLRVSGLKLNGFALMVVVLGKWLTAIIYKVANCSITDYHAGIFRGGNEYAIFRCWSANF